MREGFVGPRSRSLGLLAGVCLLGACQAPEQGSDGSTATQETKGGGSFWSPGAASGPSQPKVLRQGLVSGTDFEVTAVSGPAAVAPYGAFFIDVTVCNRGDTSVFTEVWGYLSTDTTITQEDRQVGAAGVYVDPGACTSVRMNAATDGSEGTWVLGAIVDPYEAIAEASEANNVLAGSALRVAALPDLVVSQVRGPSCALPYSGFTVTLTTCNVGTAWSPGGPVRVYRSDDATISPTDLPIGEVPVPPLPAGECLAQEVYVGGMDAGTRFLGAIADPQEQLVELDEANNASTGAEVIIGDGPDLVLRGFTAPPSVRPFEPFVVQAEVCNQGTSGAASFSVSMVSSEDEVIGGSDAPFGHMSSNDSVMPGTCLEVAITGHIPPGGVRILGGQVFSNGGPPELRPDNNLLAGPRIGVGDAPDLVVTAVAGPPNLYSGYINGPSLVTVCNQGTRESPGFSVDVFQSPDATITPADPRVGGVPFPPLNAGACASRTAWLQLQGPQDPWGASVFYLGAIADLGQWNAELREDNNTSMAHRFAIGSLPDFAIKSVSGPTRAHPGAPVEVAVTVCNEGTQGTPQLPLSVVRSSDAEIGRADVALGTLDLPPLQSGACSVVRGTVPMNGPSGATYLGALVDASNFVQEFFEDNNALAGNRIDVGSAPDLVVGAVRGPPSAEPGRSFATRVTVCNEGTQPSGSSPVTLFLSRDANITPQDMAFAGMSVPSLPPGQCHTRDVQGTLSPMQGVYTLGAIVDGPYSSIPELREDNNAAVGGELVVGPGVDYVVSAVGGPSSLAPGQNVSIPVTVCNQGTQPGPSAQVKVFLRMGTPSSPMDVEMNGAFTPPLAAGQCASVPVSNFVQGAQGTFTLGAVVDKQGSVPELHEGNNVHLARRIGVGLEADVLVRDVKGPSVVQPGSTFPVSFTVCNEGSRPVGVGAFSVDFVLSSDTTINYQDRPVSGMSSPHLDPGQCLTQSVEATHHGPMGSFFLGAVVDANDQLPELFEDNNFVAGSPLLVGSAPDLVVKALTAQPSDVLPGAPVSSQVTVCNQGNVTSAPEDVGLFQSGDALLNPEDFLISSVSIPSLAPGACATLALSGLAGGPPGVYTLGAIADPWNKLQEAREDNNALASTPPAVSTTMDLRITVAGAPGLVRPGTSFTVSEVMVCNGGVLRASNVFAELFLSLDAVLDGGDMRVAGEGFMDLEPGQCLAFPMTAFAPMSEGTYRLLGVTDAQDVEERKDNNVFVGGSLTVSTRPVDLTVTAVTAPLNASSSGSFPVTVRACNLGTIPSPSTRLELFISADALISRTSDTRVTDVSFSSLAPGACREQTVGGRAPVPAGTWWMGAVVDGTNAILEANEANNALASEPVRVGSGADLLVASVQVPPRAVAPSSGFSGTVQVCNRGTTPPNTSARLEVFLSSDALITDGDYLWTSRTLPLLPPDACTNVAVSGGVSGVGPGTWYVGVRLDGPNAVPELREDNNLHASAQVVVGLGINLVVAQVKNPSAVRQGPSFLVDAQVCNQGTQSSSPSTAVAIHLSGDATINREDVVVGEAYVPGLASGQCTWVTASVSYGGVPDGALFTVGAIVDPHGSVAELREDDNAQAGSRLQFDNRPPSTPTLSGTSPNGVGNTTTPFVSGSTEASATVRIYTNSACTGAVVGTGTASSTGGFSVSATAQANTTTTFFARATDVAGNVSACSAGRSYTHDGVAPTAPVLMGTDPVSPGTSMQPGFQGNAEPGTTVRLYTTTSCTGTVLASGAVGGTATFTLPVTVTANTTTTVYASATDAVGNISPCSTGLSYTHQDPAPITP